MADRVFGEIQGIPVGTTFQTRKDVASQICSINQKMRAVVSFFFLIFSILMPLSTKAEEILSKEDAKKTFSFSFAQWSNNAKQLQSTGAARIAFVEPNTLTLLALTSAGVLKVTPSYLPNQLQRPHKISISVEQNPIESAKTKNLSDAQLKDKIFKWYQEMLPEFTVMTNIDLIGETVQYNFSMFEKGVYPPMDIVGAESRGCWQQCIKR